MRGLKIKIGYFISPFMLSLYDFLHLLALLEQELFLPKD